MQARRGLLAGVAAALIGLTAVVWFLARDSADGSGQLRRPDDLAAAHAALDEALPQALQSAGVRGAAVALVADGRVASTAGYGVVTTDGAAVDENTVFQVGSVSKPVAAAVIARLAGSGDIDLDRPVGELLSSWALPSDTPDPDAVTLRSLLSHTAGLNVGGYLGIPDDQPLPPSARHSPVTRRRSMARRSPRPAGPAPTPTPAAATRSPNWRSPTPSAVTGVSSPIACSSNRSA